MLEALNVGTSIPIMLLLLKYINPPNLTFYKSVDTLVSVLRILVDTWWINDLVQ